MERDVASWDEFLRAVVAYRDAEFVGRSQIDGERAYLALLAELADVPMEERGDHTGSIVLFLNRWRCHFPSGCGSSTRCCDCHFGRGATRASAACDDNTPPGAFTDPEADPDSGKRGLFAG